jgi:hypothetical protein
MQQTQFFDCSELGLRNAQTFIVRDLAWDQMQMVGHTNFLPSFTTATALAPVAPSVTPQLTDQVVSSQKVTSSVATSATTTALAAPTASVTEREQGPTQPSIVTQPTNQTVRPGHQAMFSVAASGTPPLAFQWLKNGEIIPGETRPSYKTMLAKSSDNGAQFAVVVTNSVSSITSFPARLTVTTKPSTDPATDALGNSIQNNAGGNKSRPWLTKSPEMISREFRRHATKSRSTSFVWKSMLTRTRTLWMGRLLQS